MQCQFVFGTTRFLARKDRKNEKRHLNRWASTAAALTEKSWAENHFTPGSSFKLRMVIGYFDADVRRIIFLLPDQRMTCLMPLTQHSHRFRWSLTILLILSLPAFAIAQEPTKKHNSLSVMDPATKRTLGKLTKFEQGILRYTNLARKQNGKPELTAVSHLNVAAQRHAINMARQQKMEHELDGKSATDRIKAVEYQFTAFGENIAAGYPNEKAAVAGWMNSPPHKGNILDEDKRGYVHIGIGAHKAANGVWYYCQVFARPASGNDYE